MLLKSCAIFLFFVLDFVHTITNRAAKNNNNEGCGIAAQDAESGNFYQGQWPFTAVLYNVINGQLTYMCGGTIVSKVFVVTAAHCILDKSEIIPKHENDLLIRTGAFNMDNFREPGSGLHNVQKIILHEEWNPDSQNYDADIALIRTKGPMTFSEYVKPICLFKSTDITGNLNEGWLIGYGESSNVFPRKLRLPILNTQYCLRIEGGYRTRISPRMFCAGSKAAETNICGNDMGDGLFVIFRGRYHLAGVASFVMSKRYSECDFKNAALFTNAHLLAQWIDEKVRPGRYNNRTNTQKTTNLMTTFTTTRKVKPINDAIFFPSDDDYNYNKGPTRPVSLSTVTKTTRKSTESSSNSQNVIDSGEPTFDINAKGSTISSYNSITEKPIQLATGDVQSIHYKSECGVMGALKSVNGGKLAWNDFPWSATVFKKGNTKVSVIGTLLSYRHVFVNFDVLKTLNSMLPNVNDLQVYLGLNDWKKISTATLKDVQKFVNHPMDRKVGILILSSPVDYGRKIFPICLLDNGSQNLPNNAYSVGFDNDERKAGLVNIRSVNECSRRNSKVSSNNLVCTKRNSGCIKGGSPLYLMINNIWHLYATPQDAKSSQCGAGNNNEIFENLSQYSSWIQSEIISN